MGLLGFGGGKASVQVLLDRADVSPGETVQATVRVTGGRKDVQIDEGRVRLVFENEYTYRERQASFSRSTGSGVSSTTTRTRHGTDRKTVVEPRFLERGAIAADTPSEHTLAIEIPPGAEPSAEGKITRVRWHVEATLARPRAVDVSDEATLEVLSTQDSSGWDETAPEVDSHGECDLSFRLEKLAYGAGEPVEGTLVLAPSEDCKLNEVRVELVREEEVPRGEGNTEQVREAELPLDGAVELTSGAPREYPFRLEVPPDPVPTLRTDQSRVRWLLKGVGSRRMRSDYNVVQEVLVYSAPGAHVSPAKSLK
jgi:hypothetical protein